MSAFSIFYYLHDEFLNIDSGFPRDSDLLNQCTENCILHEQMTKILSGMLTEKNIFSELSLFWHIDAWYAIEYEHRTCVFVNSQRVFEPAQYPTKNLNDNGIMEFTEPTGKIHVWITSYLLSTQIESHSRAYIPFSSFPAINPIN